MTTRSFMIATVSGHGYGVRMARYVIIGAGAVGGAIGGRLTLAGLSAVLVARGDHLRAMQERGLRLRTPDEDVTSSVTAVSGPDELQLTDDDILIVATKTHQAPEALRAWADAPVRTSSAGERLPVFLATNGVASERMAQRYFRRVYGVCVWMPVVHLEPGEVIIRSTPRSGMLHLGAVPTGVGEDVLSTVAADLVAANFDAPRPDDVMEWKYRKLISNLGNVLQALVAGHGDWQPLVAAAEREARDVLDAAGIAYTSDVEESAARAAGFTMKPVPGVPQNLGGSTWQSLTRGTGNVETDYLNGEIAAIAHGIGRDAPINARLAALGRRAAATGQRPGELSAEQVAELLGL
jgi:2-dehydropantoate 2-reductase